MTAKRPESKARQAAPPPEPCPCGSGKGFAACCGPLLSGAKSAATAQALMRSRFTAYARGDFDYVLRTWHHSTRPARIDLSSAGELRWTGLQVLAARAGGRSARVGVVEFIAHCTVNGRPEQLHEVSRFVREEAQWYYIDGEIKQARLSTDEQRQGSSE